MVDDVGTLSGTHTVAVDDNLRWESVLVVLGEHREGLLDAVRHLGINDLLALLLNNEVRVVLGHLLGDGGSKADDRVSTRMADVDTDQHGLAVLHLLGELEVEEVGAHLAVDLLEDVRGLGEVELLPIPGGDHL